MTATLRVLIFAPGESVDTGPDHAPIRARVLRAQIVPGGSIRYQLGWWKDESWFEAWFPETEVRPVEP